MSTTQNPTLKMYDSFGMNPRMVRMFLLEKGIDDRVERVPVDLLGGENRRAPYTNKNIFGQLPLLELADGTYLAETGAICEYLEELYPDAPKLLGETAEERAITRMQRRRVELEVCRPAVWGFYSAEGLELFKDRVHVMPHAADDLKEQAREGLARINTLLEGNEWLCGDRFSVADICLFTYLDLLRNGGQPLPENLHHVRAWFERVSARPSAEASVWPEQPMGLRG